VITEHQQRIVVYKRVLQHINAFEHQKSPRQGHKACVHNCDTSAGPTASGVLLLHDVIYPALNTDFLSAVPGVSISRRS
jgi:hypothetical protein